MKEPMLFVLIVPAILLLCYLGYRAGLVTLSVKSAAMFYGGIYPASHLSRAKLSRATGSIRRVIFLEENKTYSFVLNCENITGGSVRAVLADRKGSSVACIDKDAPFVSFSADRGKSYTLRVEFKNADGEYTLAWS